MDWRTSHSHIDFSHSNVIWKWSNFISVIMWFQKAILFPSFTFLRVTSRYLLLRKLSNELAFDSNQFYLITRDWLYSNISETYILIFALILIIEFQKSRLLCLLKKNHPIRVWFKFWSLSKNFYIQLIFWIKKSKY